MACPPARPPIDLSPHARRVVIIAPLDVEFDAAAGLLANRTDHDLGGRPGAVGQVGTLEVMVVRSGWGKAHAAGAVGAAVEAFQPAAVMVAGIAGSLDGERLDSGDVLVGSYSWQHDLGVKEGDRVEPITPESPREERLPRYFLSDSTLVRLAAAAAREAVAGETAWQVSDCECQGRHDNARPACPGAITRPRGRSTPRVCTGTIATGDQFLAGTAAASLAQAGAVAVDMESAAAAQEASDASVSFLSIRVIADVVPLPQSESVYYCLKPYAARRLSLVLGAVLAALAQPGEVPEPQGC